MKKDLLFGLVLGIFLQPVVAQALTVVGTYNDIADRTLGFNTIRVDLTITDPTHLVEVFNQPLQARTEFNQNDMFIVCDLDHIFGDPNQSQISPTAPSADWHAGFVSSSLPWPNSVQWLATTDNASTLGRFSFAVDVANILADLPTSLPWAVHASLAGANGIAETTDSGLISMTDWAPPDPPIPSPEPATLILLTAGAVAWAAKTKKTAHHH